MLLERCFSRVLERVVCDVFGGGGSEAGGGDLGILSISSPIFLW